MGDAISILEGSTFVVSDRRGDIVPSPTEPHGLFLEDTRFLSCWRLTVAGRQPQVLSTDDVNYFSAQFFLAPPADSFYDQATFSIMRKRSVGNGFHEDLTVLNHRAEPLELDLHIEAAADFADLFEVKDALRKHGEHYHSADDGKLVLGYRREGFVRETWISASAEEAEPGEDGLRFRIVVEPQGSWTTCINVAAAVHALPDGPSVKYGHGDTVPKPNIGTSLDEWIESAPVLDTDSRSLERTYERSLVDLAALRFYPPIVPDMALPAAGLPWFMTVFGRDSLITSYQALPFTPELAETTLRVLAARQGTRVDPFRDEEPGKILHEIRFGEMTAFEERPHSPYYGAADSTPLFLIVLDETERWTGNVDLALELEDEARAGLEWIDRHGDRDGDGYVEYERANKETGLENQCWKDSHNSILFADGSQSKLPRACCEIQGYVYDAKLRCARLAREIWGDPELANRLEREAAELKRRFNEDFWLADRGYFALALDGDKRPVDSLTSNIGHLLWSGIVHDDKAESVARHLVGPRLFSGWGVRTMAEGDGGYNPIGYHNGTVWPHDNSLIAAGLARYGYRREAAQVAFAMLEAAEFFEHRLPEAFAGYERGQTFFPVEYPTACSPQAWATGAPLLFITTMLGLEPGDRTGTDAVLPEEIEHLELTMAAPRSAVGPRRRAVQRGDSARPAPDGVLPSGSVSTARELFAVLQEHIDPSFARKGDGSFRFDVHGAGSWRLEVREGELDVAESTDEADLVVELTEEVLLSMARGEQNASTAFLSGSVKLAGDLALAPRLERFMPQPPGA